MSQEQPRYKISLKPGYKITYILISTLFFAFAPLVGGLAAINSNNLSNRIFTAILVLFLLGMGIAALVPVTTKLEAYKGKLVYSSIIKKREYRLSEITTSNSHYEETMIDYKDGIVSSNYDKISTFYDKNGTKLFKFGLAYANVDCLIKDVVNVQKSINHQKGK